MTNSNENKKSLKSFYWLWAILTVLGVAASLYAPGYLMPKSMSQSMHLSILTMGVFSVAAAPVAAGVYAAALYILRNWTHKGDTVPAAGPAFRESGKVVITWTLTSILLTVFLLIWGLGALAADGAGSTSNPLVVKVVGQQWVWSFEYQGANGTTVMSHDLYLPKGRDVQFHITSLDVTHGFWLPQMGIQVDANNDTITDLRVTPNKLGTFDVRCTQFCGLNHAFMVTQGHVLTPSAFTTWLNAQPARS